GRAGAGPGGAWGRRGAGVWAEGSERRATGAVCDLMGLFARALRGLGEWRRLRYGGSFARAVEASGGSAERLAASLAEMPLYRDVARFAGVGVPFYKRAQITAGGLAAPFGGPRCGGVRDPRGLTGFAPTLVRPARA